MAIALLQGQGNEQKLFVHRFRPGDDHGSGRISPAASSYPEGHASYGQ